MTARTPELFAPHTVLPRLRSDLVISPQKYRGRTSFVIKDPIALRYYRLGALELQVARLLDGQRTLAEVCRTLRQHPVGRDVDQATVAKIVTHFAQLSFLQFTGEQAQRVFAQLRVRQAKVKRWQRVLQALGVVVYFKIPLFDPDLLLLRMEKRLRFLWSRPARWAMLTLCGVALGVLAMNLDRLFEPRPDFFTLHNLIWLWVVLVGVKIVHEFGHGLMCKHYGGEVHEMGAMVIVLTPFLYCDATDSWMFQDKRQKIAVNSAGILVELILASLATIAWAVTAPGLVNQLAFNVMVVCSISTVVFNANPLMKFDGYYVLADWLEIPNLRDRAMQQVNGALVQLFTGQPPPPSSEPVPWRRWMFAGYAVASYCYVWFIMIRIFDTLGYRLEPYGLGGLGRTSLLLTYGVGFLIPMGLLAKTVSSTARQQRTGGLILRRLSKIAAGFLAGVVLIAFCPWPMEVTASCVLRGANRVSVRAAATGFLREIEVDAGDRVVAGQRLAVLANSELATKLAQQEILVQVLELQVQQAQAAGNSALLSRLAKDLTEHQAELNLLRQQFEKLELRAPLAGTILTPQLMDRNGDLLREGDLFCEILPTGAVEVVIALTEDQANLVRVGQPVELRVYALPGRRFYGKVASTFVAPAEQLPHAAMAGRFGGRVPTEITVSGQERPTTQLYQAQLHIGNPNDVLRIGMSGHARIRCGRSTLGHIFLRKARSLIRHDFQL